MRKASKIIYLVGAIVSIVVAASFLIWGIVTIVIPNSDIFVQDFIETYNANPTKGVTAEEALRAVQGVMIACGVFLILGACCGVVNSVLAFKAHHAEKPSKVLNILNIVFGVLSCVEINIVAAIFAFVANGQEERHQQVEQK